MTEKDALTKMTTHQPPQHEFDKKALTTMATHRPPQHELDKDASLGATRSFKVLVVKNGVWFIDTPLLRAAFTNCCPFCALFNIVLAQRLFL